MQFQVDQTTPMPIYAQLMEQIRWAVSSGSLQSGAQLPTVRQLAVELRINPNTVAHAYRELERAGVIATRQGRGTFVTAGQPRATEVERRAELERLARSAISEAGNLGYTPAELRQAITDITGQEDNEDGLEIR